VRRNSLLALAVVAAASSVHGAEPLVTDDAEVVTAKACQVEAWIRPMRGGREYWVQPACNFGGNLEVAVGGARFHPDGGESSSSILLQAKWVPFARDEGSWSFGAIGSAVRETGAPHGGSAFQTYHGRLLASWYPRDDFQVDLNLGVANAHEHGTFSIAGAAVQYALTSGAQLLGEIFRDEPGRTKYQAGVRWTVIPNRFEVYAAYGDRFSGSSRSWFATIGIRLQTPAFLP
jgi:hypothetical protein